MVPDDASRPDSPPADAQAPPRDGAPGSVSSPRDVGDRGTVGLEDRTRAGGQGSPDTNQAKAEPMPATPGEPDPAAPLEPPLLADMNVGGADPQSPSHPAARERDVPAAGGSAAVAGGSGTAQRAPGSLGTSPERAETDLDASAAATQPAGGAGSTPAPVQPGDAQDVPVPHEEPAEGSSQAAPIVHGVRAADPPRP